MSKKSLPSWRSTSERKRSRVLVQLLAAAINQRFQRKCSRHRCAISLRNGDVSCLVSFVTAFRSLTLPLASAGERTDARLKTHEMRERDGGNSGLRLTSTWMDSRRSLESLPHVRINN